ncbi:MAG TPA: transposase [Acidobacteriaceae bacterium]
MPDNHYATNVNDAAWALLAPLLPAARPGGRPRTTDIRAVINAIFYLLRTGCQWRLLGVTTPKVKNSTFRKHLCYS